MKDDRCPNSWPEILLDLISFLSWSSIAWLINFVYLFILHSWHNTGYLRLFLVQRRGSSSCVTQICHSKRIPQAQGSCHVGFVYGMHICFRYILMFASSINYALQTFYVIHVTNEKLMQPCEAATQLRKTGWVNAGANTSVPHLASVHYITCTTTRAPAPRSSIITVRIQNHNSSIQWIQRSKVQTNLTRVWPTDRAQIWKHRRFLSSFPRPSPPPAKRSWLGERDASPDSQLRHFIPLQRPIEHWFYIVLSRKYIRFQVSPSDYQWQLFNWMVLGGGKKLTP
jgi:hypothetical protein